jgi:hypothetical protein
MLARAFAEDPIARWAAPNPRARPGMLERFHGTRLRQLLVHGDTWVSPGCESAALWAPPGAWKTTAREDLELTRSMLHPRLLRRAPLVAAGLPRRRPTSITTPASASASPNHCGCRAAPAFGRCGATRGRPLSAEPPGGDHSS